MSVELDMVKIKFNVFKNNGKVKVWNLDELHLYALMRMINGNGMIYFHDQKKKLLIRKTK